MPGGKKELSSTDAQGTSLGRCRMLRSPSHESVTTDLSLFSVSSTNDVNRHQHHRFLSFKSGEQRGSSPNPEGKSASNRYVEGVFYLYWAKNKNTFSCFRPADIPEIIWFEDGHDLIRSCGALSLVLGIQKSFSTSDITQISLSDNQNSSIRLYVSELALNSLQRCGYLLDNPRLEQTSRSCSTWVAVGELASTSQLPSPHGGPSNVPLLNTSTPPPPAFTAADLIRSVNKKVRQNYIRKRLLTTYRAIERLSQSEFNLDRLEAVAAAATAICGPGPTELVVPTYNAATGGVSNVVPSDTTSLAGATSSNVTQIKKKITIDLSNNLTLNDIERERGKPLTKYERNMMVFNWLHSLDENAIPDDLP